MDDNASTSMDNMESEKHMCEPCLENKESKPAVNYCEDCDEYLCSGCTDTHHKIKATKSHTPITTEAKRLKDLICCDQCSSNENIIEAINFCSECEEYLCVSCSDIHKRTKATKIHELTKKENVKQSSQNIVRQCSPCNEGGKECQASHFCQDCEELLCESCVQIHKQIKLTHNHAPLDLSRYEENTTKDTKNCMPCKKNGIVINSTKYCSSCEEYLCKECSDFHANQKITRLHCLIEPPPQPDLTKDNQTCDPCSGQNKFAEAKSYCKECCENFCSKCADKHISQRLSRNHTLINALEPENIRSNVSSVCNICEEVDGVKSLSEAFCLQCQISLCHKCKMKHSITAFSKDHEYTSASKGTDRQTKNLCDHCNAVGKTQAAVALCTDCKNENMCESCVKIHKLQRGTAQHNLVNFFEEKNEKDETKQTE